MAVAYLVSTRTGELSVHVFLDWKLFQCFCSFHWNFFDQNVLTIFFRPDFEKMSVYCWLIFFSETETKRFVSCFYSALFLYFMSFLGTCSNQVFFHFSGRFAKTTIKTNASSFRTFFPLLLSSWRWYIAVLWIFCRLNNFSLTKVTRRSATTGMFSTLQFS